MTDQERIVSLLSSAKFHDRHVTPKAAAHQSHGDLRLRIHGILQQEPRIGSDNLPDYRGNARRNRNSNLATKTIMDTQ